MVSHGKTIGLVMVGLLLSAPKVVQAEGPRPPSVPPPAAERKAEKDRLREQIIDKLRAERMWKLTETLKLDEPTAARLFPLLARFEDQERAIAKERGPIARDLRDAINRPNPDQNRINGLVEKLMAIRTRRQALDAEKLAAVRKVLTPVQMGKLMLVAPKIDEGFRERIRDALQTARQAGELRGRAAPGADDWP